VTAGYCYDVMSKAWATGSAAAPVKDSELAVRFRFPDRGDARADLRLKDAINHDGRVTGTARKLDGAQWQANVSRRNRRGAAQLQATRSAKLPR
jgi:hypothetical protein